MPGDEIKGVDMRKIAILTVAIFLMLCFVVWATPEWQERPEDCNYWFDGCNYVTCEEYICESTLIYCDPDTYAEPECLDEVEKEDPLKDQI